MKARLILQPSLLAIFWCFLTSCVGEPLRRVLSNLWEDAIRSAETSRQDARMRRSPRSVPQYEEFEMGPRNSRPYGQLS